MENIGNQEKESTASVTQQAGQPRRLLVVGAGGFVGGYFVEEGLRRGFEVWAGVRASTRLDRFTDPRIKFVKFDFDEPASLVATLREALPEGRWDYVIYNLGATKVLKYADFNRINYEYLRAFTGALHESGKVPERLLYMSSLSVVGPQGEKDYAPLTEDMIPRPNTRYGASKLKAELWLATAGIPYVIFRATGVYGPWDKDYLLEFESMRKGFDFGVGFRRQMLTFIFAPDLARAAYDALAHARDGEVYHISEERAYSQKEFRGITARALGGKRVFPVRVPIWMVAMVCAVAEKIGALRGRPSTLNSDKLRILRQRNWCCSTRKAADDFGFASSTPLADGVKATVDWYRKEGWMK